MPANRNACSSKRRIANLLVAVFLLISSIQLSSISVAADSTKRVPRSIDEIPRPTELRLGLSQVEYKGYFSRDPRWFSDARFDSFGSRNATTLPSGITGIESPSASTSNSYSFTGYFIPDSTGEWQFQLAADDAGLVWLGNDAVINYASKLANPFLEAYWPDKITTTRTITLIKNTIYPLRIQFGNSGGPSDLKLKFKSPGKNVWEENFTNLLWRSPENTGDCTNFGLSYTLSALLGYDNSIPDVCKKDGTDKYIRTWVKPKPEIPSLVSTKLIASGLVFEVMIGDIEVSKIYLTAPSIGYTNSSNLKGTIKGKIATFVIPTAKLKDMSRVDVNFVSSNDQGTATTTKKAVLVVLPKTSSAPSTKPAPKKTVPAPKTVRCDKGDKTRVFAGTTCPPGWSK